MTELLGRNITIGRHVEIGRNVHIGDNVIINDDVTIGDDSFLEAGCIVGYRNLTHQRETHAVGATVMERGVRIRAGAIVYAGCRIGEASQVCHQTVLRENTVIGHHTSIGNFVMCEGYTKIGNFVNIHAQCHLTALLEIEDKVFFGPMVKTANDRKMTWMRHDKMVNDEKGPTVRYGVRVGVGATLLPGVEIGREALVAAGALVVKDVRPFAIVMGVPAKEVGEVPENERLSEPAETRA